MSETLGTSTENQKLTINSQSNIVIPKREGTERNEKEIKDKSKENERNKEKLKIESKKETALLQLQIINNNYNEKSGFGNTIDTGLSTLRVFLYRKISGSDKITVQDLDSEDKNKTLLNKEQERLIEIILGTKKGFNNEYIQGFNNEKGNYLIKINDFENKYETTENIQNLNSLELGNYIKYLSEKNDDKSQSKINEIRLRFGNDKKFFKKIKKRKTLIKYIKNTFNEAEKIFDNLIDSLFNNLDDFKNKLNSASKIEQKEIIEHLKNNSENHKQDFITSIQNSLSKDKSEEERLEIATIFVEDLIKTPDIGDILKKIEAFEKEQGINVNEEEITKETLQYQKYEKQVELLEARYKGDRLSEEKLSAELKIINFNSNTINALSSSQFNILSNRLRNGESFDNIIQEIAKENKELQKILDEEKSTSESENKGEEKEENNKYYIDKDDYINSDAGYTIRLENGEKIPGLTITKEERDLTMGNPEALKNLINFYKFFKDLNLEGVWKYRKELALSMGDVNINLNDNNSVSEAELLKFGKKLIKFINSVNEEDPQIPYRPGFKISENIGNLSGLKSALRTYSGASSELSNDATYNMQGEDRFTASLRKHGIIGGAYFHTIQFRKLMN